MSGYPNPYDVYVPSDTAARSMMVGYSRFLTCRRFLEYLRDGAIFAFVEMAGSIWMEIARHDSGTGYYAHAYGFLIDDGWFKVPDPDNGIYDPSNWMVVVDGLGLPLCRLVRAGKSTVHGGSLYILGDPPGIDPAILATCGDEGGLPINRYKQISPKPSDDR